MGEELQRWVRPVPVDWLSLRAFCLPGKQAVEVVRIGGVMQVSPKDSLLQGQVKGLDDHPFDPCLAQDFIEIDIEAVFSLVEDHPTTRYLIVFHVPKSYMGAAIRRPNPCLEPMFGDEGRVSHATPRWRGRAPGLQERVAAPRHGAGTAPSASCRGCQRPEFFIHDHPI